MCCWDLDPFLCSMLEVDEFQIFSFELNILKIFKLVPCSWVLFYIQLKIFSLTKHDVHYLLWEGFQQLISMSNSFSSHLWRYLCSKVSISSILTTPHFECSFRATPNDLLLTNIALCETKIRRVRKVYKKDVV